MKKQNMNVATNATSKIPVTSDRVPVSLISAEAMEIVETLIYHIGDKIADEGRVELLDELFHVLGYQVWCTVNPIRGNTVHLLTIRYWVPDGCRTIMVDYRDHDDWKIFHVS